MSVGAGAARAASVPHHVCVALGQHHLVPYELGALVLLLQDAGCAATYGSEQGHCEKRNPDYKSEMYTKWKPNYSLAAHSPSVRLPIALGPQRPQPCAVKQIQMCLRCVCVRKGAYVWVRRRL